MSYIVPGYMGSATIDGSSSVRFESANITAKQDVLIPDVVMANWDRLVYGMGKIEVGGTISGPVTELFTSGASSIWNWAMSRGGCGEIQTKSVQLNYYCSGLQNGNNGRNFPELAINSMAFSCAAGEVAQFNIDLIGATKPTWSGSSTVNNTEEKLVTWDVVHASSSLLTSQQLSNFEFTVNNNITPVYAIQPDADYFPQALVPGIRTITGSVSIYGVPSGFDGADNYAGVSDGAEDTINFSIGEATFSVNVRYHRVEPTLSVGPIISTVAFTGTNVQSNL